MKSDKAPSKRFSFRARRKPDTNGYFSVRKTKLFELPQLLLPAPRKSFERKDALGQTYFRRIHPKHLRRGSYVGITALLIVLLITQLTPSLKPTTVMANATFREWTSQADFTNNSGATSAVSSSYSSLVTTPGSVQMQPTVQDLGTGADGQLIVDGTTVGGTKIILPNNSVIVLGCGSTPNTGIVCNSANPLYLDLAYVKSNNTYNFTSITLQNSGVLTHSIMSVSKGGVEGIEMYATGNVVIDSGSSINVSGRSTKTTGAGASFSACYGGPGGGGYGGNGGPGGGGNAGGSVYGDNTVQYMGSPGGYGFSGTLGGNGGGRVKIVSSVITVDGTIQANGLQGTNFSGCSPGSAGGSGGGIYLKAATIGINNYVSAAGGGGGTTQNVGNPNPTSGSNGTGGNSYYSVSTTCLGGSPGLAGNGGNGADGNTGCSVGGKSAGAGGGGRTYGGGAGGGGAGRVTINAGSVNSTSLESLANQYSDTPGASNKIGPYAYYIAFAPFYTIGALGGTSTGNIGLRVDNGVGAKTKFTSVEPSYNTLATNEAVKTRLRIVVADTNGNGPQDELNTALWYGPSGLVSDMNSWTSNYFGSSNIAGDTNPANNNIPDAVPTARYGELMVRLESWIGMSSPTLNSIKLNYNEALAPATLISKKANDNVISSGATNETTAKLVFNGIPTASGAITPEIELSTSSGFSGTAGVPSGVTVSNPTVTGTINVDQTNLTATVSGLTSGNTYYWKARFIDSAGVQSPWSSATGTFIVEQDSPAITAFSVSGTNVTSVNGNTYAKSQEVTLNITATDMGTVKSSPLPVDLYMRFSNNGTSWGTVTDSAGLVTDTVGNCTSPKYWDTANSACWVPYSATYSWSLIKGAMDGGTDGARNVQAQVMDKAGNVPKSVQTSDTDFNTGIIKSNVSVGSGNITLAVNTEGAKWTKGQAESGYPSSLIGKYIYYQDMVGYKWRNPSAACISPYCATNLDLDFPTRYSLVSPQLNPAIDFSIYPAQNACKAVGGRLPTANEFKAIIAGQTAGRYGSFSGLYYYTSTVGEINGWAWIIDGNNPNSAGNADQGNTGNSFRCITDVPQTPYYSPAIFESLPFNYGSQKNGYGSLKYNVTTPTGTSLTVSVRAGKTINGDGSPTLDGTWTSYSVVTSGTDLDSSFDGKQYLQYKIEMAGGDNTPTFSDISVDTYAASPLILDTTFPTVNSATIIAPNGSEKWKGGTTKTITWDTTKISDPNSGSNSGLKAAPITLKYATDGTNYTNTIATGLTNGINSGCTPGAGGGCYTWTLPTIVGADSNNVKVQLVAEDNVNLSATDTSNSAFALDTQPPTTISTLHAELTGASATKNPVSLHWTAPTDNATNVASYNVYRSTTNGQLGTMVSTTGAITGTTYTDTAPADTTYYYTVRGVDNSSDGGNENGAGNQLAVTVDSTGPTSTINGFWGITPASNGITYSGSNTVNLNVTATDTGGSNLASYQLSLDGTTWCNNTTISGSSFASNSTDNKVTIDLKDTNCGGVADSGAKNVYIKFTDAAGNVSGTLQSTTTDYSTGTRGANITLNSGNLGVSLLKSNGMAATLGPECASGYVSGGVCAADPWVSGFAGRTGTAMEGKEVYYQNSTSTSWGPVGTCTGPQCGLGLDSHEPTGYSFVADNTVDFVSPISYPARQACKLVNGRLPKVSELMELYDGQASYGNNFGTGYFWTATHRSSTGTVWHLYFLNDNLGSGIGSTSNMSVRCVRDVVANSGGAGPAGTYVSPVKDLGVGKTLNSIDWNTVTSPGTITMQVKAGNTVTPDDTWSNSNDWVTITRNEVNTDFLGKRYVQYKATLSFGGGSTVPNLTSVILNKFDNVSITLDQHPPDAFSLTSPTTQWSGSNKNPTFTWTASGDPVGIKEYWLSIDKNSDGDFLDAGEKEVKSAATLSSTALATLSNGNHKWKVTAVDFAGNTTDSTQTDWTYGFDDQKPSALLGGSFGINTIYNNQTIKLEWSNKGLNSNKGYVDTAIPIPGSPTSEYVIQRIKYRYLDATYTATSDNWNDYAADTASGYAEFTGIPYAPLNFIDDNTLDVSDPHYVESSELYRYRVRVIDTAGNISDWSSSTNWYKDSSTRDNLPPDYPQNVTASPGVDGFSVNINIGTPANDNGVGTIGYKIYRTTIENSETYSDYDLVGYFSVISGQNLDYIDNDANVIAEVKENIHVDTDGVITEEEIVVKPALGEEKRLNDNTTYYYRVLGMDLMGNTFYLNANGNPIYDVISRDKTAIPVTSDNRNYAGVTTADVTDPCWAHYTGTTLTSCDSEGSLELSATGLDGIDDINDPMQKIEASWGTASDFNNLDRTPSGNGLGIKNYSVSYAIGDVNAPTGEFQSVDVATGTSIVVRRLEPKPNYYWFKVTVNDNNDPSLSRETALIKKQTLSNDYPNPPYYVNVNAVRGDPSASGTRVGKDIQVSFVGSMIKNEGNFITGYKAYRTSETNSTPVPVWEVSGLKIPGDTRDTGDSNCNSLIPPNSIDKESNTFYGTRCFTDTIPSGEDAKKYTYRIYAEGTNPDIDPTGVLTSQSPSSVNQNIQGYGWDIVPDATRPASVAGVVVKNIHPDKDPSSDITNEYRNIITWQRIATPTRNGSNDFLEYRLYKSIISGSEVLYTQVLDENGDNPLRSVDPDLSKLQNQEKSLGTNYYIDRLGVGTDVNNEFSYKVVAVDNSGSDFLFAAGIRDSNDENNISGQPINTYKVGSETIVPYNVSIVTDDSMDSLNPTTAFPSIVPLTSGSTLKAEITYRGVSSLTIHWHTDQIADSLVEYRLAGTDDTFVAAGDTRFVKDHSATLKGLTPGKTYEYNLYSRNKLGNAATAENPSVYSYTILPRADTEEFTITYKQAESKMSTMSAELHWSTNMPSNTNIVEYTLASGEHNGSQAETPATINESNLGQYSCTGSIAEVRLCDHMVNIAPLRTSSNYMVKIKAISLDGYVAYTDNLVSLWTSESDSSKFTIAPEASNIADRNITSTTAQIVWETAIPTKATVYYGTYPGARDLSVVDNQITTRHVIQITGLIPGVTYYYIVAAEDINGFKYQSPEYSFKAVIKPKISNMSVRDVTPYSVTVAWETNVDTETVINWGTTAAYGEKRGISGVSRAHQIKVDNLLDNQEYHYQILAKDEVGNEVADTDKIIRTPLDTEGPKITNAKVDILPMGESDTTSSIIVSWQTNKPASTQVRYGEGIIGGDYENESVEDASLNNSHTVIIKGLKPASSYHYKMVSKDRRNNITESQDYTFVTPTKEKSILQLILKSLEETFSWTQRLNQFFGKLGQRFMGK